VPSLSMVYEVLARDLASPAFRTVAAEAKNLQRVMLEVDAKMTAASKAATAEISASLAGLDRAHTAAALQYDRANQTMIRSDDSILVMQRKMAASTGALLGEQRKAAAANIELDAAMGRAQTDLTEKTAASHAARGKGLRDLGKASAVALGVIGYESVKAAMTFESSMARVQTMAGASASDIKSLGAALLDMAPKVGMAPDKLAESLYHVESAGFRGKAALDQVFAAARLANIGNTDINLTSQAIIATMASGIKGVKDANDASALILKTVGLGDTTMQKVTEAIGTGILTTASAVGLSFKDFGAALATLTDNAIPADVAANKLRTTFLIMETPTAKAKAALDSIGMSSTSLAMDMRKPNGLQVALNDLRTHLNRTFPANGGVKLSIDGQKAAVAAYTQTLMSAGVSGKELKKLTDGYAASIKTGGSNAVLATQAFSNIFGGSKTAGTVLTLYNEQDRYNGKLTQFGTVASRAKDVNDAWAKTQATLKQQIKDLSASWKSLEVTLGNQLLPVGNCSGRASRLTVTGSR